MWVLTTALTAVAVLAAVVGAALVLRRARTGEVGLGTVGLAGLAAGAVGFGALVVASLLGLNGFGTMHLQYLCFTVALPLLGVVVLVTSRRRTVRPAALAAAVVLVQPAPLGWYATHIAPFQLRVERIDVPLASGRGGEDRMTVAVLADLQTTGVGDHERAAVAAAMAADPDVVLLPGDLFQGSDAEFTAHEAELRALLGRLRAPGGVYVVRGDVDNGDRVDRAVRGTGIRILDDEVVEARVGDRALRIGGTRLDYRSRAAERVRDRLRAATDDEVTVLVSHRPDTVLELPPDSGIDLTVAGHTHGGQVAVPLLGPPLTLSGVPREVGAGGLHRLDGNRIYVSPGIGMERGQAPQIRFLVRPTVALLQLGDG